MTRPNPIVRLTELNYNEILMYLGYRGQELDAAMEKQIGKCIDLVVKHAKPAAVWRFLPVHDGQTETLVLEGNDIHALLADCHEAILMAATLGPEIDRLLMRYEVRDMADAFIMDACAAAAIENVCNNLEADFRTELRKEGLFLTDRFSPGYGDMPIESQNSFAEFLDTGRRIGLSVSNTHLMIPRKSVTAVMGISKFEQKRRASGCENCSMFRNCAFRKNGRTC